MSLYHAIRQQLFNLACVLDLNKVKLWINDENCESADGKLYCPADSKLWGSAGLIAIFTIEFMDKFCDKDLTT